MVKCFLIRRINDLDHMVPIIAAFCERGDRSIWLFTVNPSLAISEDFRVRFLRETYNLRVQNLYKFSFSRNRKWYEHVLDLFSSITDRLRWLVGWASPRAAWPWRIFNEAWARHLLIELRVDVLVVDWQKPGRYRSLQIMTAARQLGVPVVAVPHAVPLQKNMLITRRQQKRGLPASYKLNSRFFDLIIAPHEKFSQRLTDAGVSTSDVAVIGSARFCSEWRQTLKDLRDEYYSMPLDCDSFWQRGALRVVFLDHDTKYRTERDVIRSDLIKIGQMECIDLVAVTDPEMEEAIRKRCSRSRFASFSDVPFLLESTNAVMTTASSMMIDAVMLGKALVYPKHFHKNEMIFEDYSFCRTVGSEDELIELLRAMSSTASDVLMDSSDKHSADRFIEEVVYGGRKRRGVLQDYVGEIDGIAARYQEMKKAFPL